MFFGSDSDNDNIRLTSLVVVEWLYHLTILVFSISCIILFLEKQSSLPLLLRAFLIVTILIPLLDLLVFSMIDPESFEWTSDNTSNTVKAFIRTIIWVPYLYYSVRLKEMFTVQYDSFKPGNEWLNDIDSEYSQNN